MESQPECHIRESSRILMRLNRRNIREEENDSRRSLPGASANSSTVTDIANKLKTSSSLSAEELRTLKNALLEDGQHTETILGTHGALRGLVREISGHDIRKQCEAVACCCNLALSDRGCLTIVKTAGPYLVTGLDSQSVELAVNSAWAVGNLASSPEASQLLQQQGALGRLLAAAESSNHEVADAALYAIGHLVYWLGELRPDQVTRLLKLQYLQDNTSSYGRLLFMLSWDPEFGNKISEELLRNILDTFSVSLQTHLDANHRRDCCNLMYLVRLLANVCTENSKEISASVVEYLVENSMAIGLGKLVGRKEEGEEVLWLLGNLFSYCGNDFCRDEFFKCFLLA